MSWFSNKKETKDISDIPELPELPDSPNADFILQSPPYQSPPQRVPAAMQQTFPQQPKITQEYSDEIFRPIINEPKPGMQRSKFSPPDLSMQELSKKPIENFGISKIKELRYEPPEDTGISKTPGYFKPAAKNFMKKDESVYIKLEKFQITMEAFREIKDKIREIEDILAKTKEIRAREEKELEEWEREIEAIKLKLDSIDREISNSGN